MLLLFERISTLSVNAIAWFDDDDVSTNPRGGRKMPEAVFWRTYDVSVSEYAGKVVR